MSLVTTVRKTREVSIDTALPGDFAFVCKSILILASHAQK
jgi:hypothetical protein